MANLKGSTYTAQIKDAYFRLNNIGKSKKYAVKSNLTHSINMLNKREAMLKDFANYCLKNNLDAKLNNNFTNTIIANFLLQRLNNVSYKSAQTYVTGFNSMLQGLKNCNINMLYTNTNVLQQFKSTYVKKVTTGKTNFNVNTLNTQLLNNSYNAYVCAQIQLETGFRGAEAIEVLNNFKKYFNSGALIGVRGKGGRVYCNKQISTNLQALLTNVTKTYTYKSYNTQLNKLNISTHNLRYMYAKNIFNNYLQINTYKQALLLTSTQLNHSRADITQYYLKRS